MLFAGLILYVGSFLLFFYSFHVFVLLLSLELVLLGALVSLFLGGLAVGVAVCFFFLLVLVCMGGYGVALVVGGSRHVGRDWWSLGGFFSR